MPFQLLLLALWGLFTIVLARLICGRWINHLSVYSGTWTLSLSAYELRLIAYNRITLGAWFFIFAAWIAIYIGTFLARFAVIPVAHSAQTDALDTKWLSRVIVAFTCAGLASSSVLAWRIVHSLGSSLFLALTVQANEIYTMRFDGELSGLAYIGFLPYAASALAGSYAARRGRLNLVSLSPLAAMALDGVLSMQRAGMVIAAILFVVALFLTPSNNPYRLPRSQIVAAFFLMIVAFMSVTMVRGIPPVFENQGEALNRLGDLSPSLPSLYMYVSAPPAGFSAYLQDVNADGAPFWGRYTFAPIYRLLAKLGFDTYVPYYTNFFSTPVPINTCTYLRDLYSDFGQLGIVAFPAMLGMLIGALEAKHSTVVSQMILAHLYVVVCFSFSSGILITGYWYISLVGSVLASLFVRTRSKRLNCRLA